jgi:hypothetical protein
MAKWLTKIYNHSNGMMDLIIEKTGKVVLSSSDGYKIWDERTKIEELLRCPAKCQKCEYHIYSKTLGSPDCEEWHCRQGFNPTDRDCQAEADRNDAIKREYYKNHPEELQLKLNF